MPHLGLYAASSRVLPPHLYAAGFDFGRRAAAKGYGLVFGGANIGLMDAVARGFKSENAHVVSVIPRIFDRQGLTFSAADEVHLTDDLRTRKRMMLDRADVIVVFPGGPGTLDEFFETLTLKQLGFHSKPILIVNLDGHFDGTLVQIQRMVEQGFASEHLNQLFESANTIDDALSRLPAS